MVNGLDAKWNKPLGSIPLLIPVALPIKQGQTKTEWDGVGEEIREQKRIKKNGVKKAQIKYNLREKGNKENLWMDHYLYTFVCLH